MFTLREQSLLTLVVHFHLQKNTTHHLKIKENKRKPYRWLKSTDAWTRSLRDHMLFSCCHFRPHGLQHTRLPGPSPSPGACSNSCPLSQWCHPTISSSVTPSPPALNLSQNQSLFQGVSSSHQAAKVLEHNVLKRGEEEAEYSCLVSFLQVIFGQNRVFYVYYL